MTQPQRPAPEPVPEPALAPSSPLLRRRGPAQRRLEAILTAVLVILAPVLVIATTLVLGPFADDPNLFLLRLVVLADLVYILVVAALVLGRIARLIVARRTSAAGSRLHLRLSGLFAVIALVPAITVAVFAVITINIGLESWFSERVRNVVQNSLAAAEAYQSEQERSLIADGEAIVAVLQRARQLNPAIQDGEIRQILSEAQRGIQRGLRVAFVISSDGELLIRGERSYLFDFVQPSPEDLARAANGETVLIKDWPNSEFRALFPLPNYAGRILYIARAVDGEILSLLDETQATIAEYTLVEAERGRVLLTFGLLYLGFAAILILAAIWLGMWFAEGLSRPIGRLAAAAERVGEGDLEAQVIEEPGDDEIATLGRVFNQMIRQIRAQRDALLANTRQIEARRRLFDSVLSSVTAGVIGLDAAGRVAFVNRAAVALTRIDADSAERKTLDEVVPEFAPLLDRLRNGDVRLAGGHVQDEVRLSRGGRLESLLVRIAERRTAAGELEGYVVAFDDVTDLVSAQRMAAWGDVARRIAHEIKNPLTPIQLSADRIRRKFARQLPPEEAEALETLTGVIVRQTEDLRRIVDEFSRFARMPEPDRRPVDLVALVRDAVTLQQAGQEAGADGNREEGRPGVSFDLTVPPEPLIVEIDPTMISQALTNLLKNAGEATEGLIDSGRAPQGYRPRVEVALNVDPSGVTIAIADNGIGLPEDRARLFEPYVTTREKGTGLGLAIVKKIIEEHGGTLELRDAPAMDGAAHRGALALIRLPLLGRPRGNRNQNGQQA